MEHMYYYIALLKKTRKTPEREKAKARRELNDYMERRGFYDR